ncbi:hypothetical protein KY321_01105, partial [Candidatus Woesearchaeota archaeon]|nr:hypothetical protein [Candidatus Woesearchaeota archaeon]
VLEFKFNGYYSYPVIYDGGDFVYLNVSKSDLVTESGCIFNSDCESGEVCQDNECEDFVCDDDGDCDSGKICDANECINNVTCVSNSDCASNQECNNEGQCVKKVVRRGGGGGSSRERETEGLGDATCITRWICTEFGECVDGYHTRNCFKEDPCNDSSIKPIERAICDVPVVLEPLEDAAVIEEPIEEIKEEYIPPVSEPVEEDIEEESSGILFIVFLSISVLLIGALGYAYYDHLKHSIKSYKVDPRMDKYVKETTKQGFTKDEIKGALINAGWKKDKVEKYFYETRSDEKVSVPSKTETPLKSALRKNVQSRPDKMTTSGLNTVSEQKPSSFPKKDQESLDKLNKIANPIKNKIKIDPELKSYINKTLNQGYTKKEVERVLKKKGWKKEAYQEYLQNV